MVADRKRLSVEVAKTSGNTDTEALGTTTHRVKLGETQGEGSRHSGQKKHTPGNT